MWVFLVRGKIVELGLLIGLYYQLLGGTDRKRIMGSHSVLQEWVYVVVEVGLNNARQVVLLQVWNDLASVIGVDLQLCMAQKQKPIPNNHGKA